MIYFVVSIALTLVCLSFQLGWFGFVLDKIREEIVYKYLGRRK